MDFFTDDGYREWNLILQPYLGPAKVAVIREVTGYQKTSL